MAQEATGEWKRAHTPNHLTCNMLDPSIKWYTLNCSSRLVFFSFFTVQLCQKYQNHFREQQVGETQELWHVRQEANNS